jgi:glycosyltransferase involved in cell wall biosynthesis
MQAKRDQKELNILFVISGLTVGGSERQLVLLASALARTGMDVAVYSFVDGPVRATLQSNGVEVVLAPGGGVATTMRAFTPITALHLFWVMLRRRPRIVHFFLPGAYLVGAPAAILANIPVRVMSRRSLNNYQQGNPLSALIERKLHPAMTAVLGNSRRVIEQLGTLERVPQEKLVLIYNGVKVAPAANEARSSVRSSLDIAEDALVLIVVANLIPYKGHRDLIEALGQVASRLSAGWRLLVVGRDDGIGRDLTALALSKGIATNVMFLGARDDVGDLLAAADVNLLTSHQEGFPNAVLEGMAAQLPSIVTDVGGNSEAIVDGQCGLVAPPHQPDRLAAAIERLAGDRVLRLAMGKNALARCREKFSIESCIARHQELYAALLAGRNPSEIASIHLDLTPDPAKLP